jgi:hypothetical protein
MEIGATAQEPRRSPCGTTTGDVISVALAVQVGTPPGDALTERSRSVWSAGDYDRISAGFRDEAEAFVGRFGLRPGRPSSMPPVARGT